MPLPSTQKLISLVLYTVSFLFGAAVTYLILGFVFFSPLQRGVTATAPFLIERNWSIQAVAKALEQQKLVRFWWATYFLARLKKDQLATVKPGEYTLSAGMTPLEILERFIREEIAYHELQVTEGLTVAEVAERMAKTGLTTLDTAQTLLRDKALMAKLDVPADSFEGYLFPDTYRFSRPDDAEFMITTMVKTGEKRRTKAMYNRAIELGLTMHQVLTLASIIEKETGKKEERKTISSVFHNRLRIGMPLQADPTVIYGLKHFDGNLTREHLAAPSAYNTYLNTGLPPTPICNPGSAAIEAALYPEDTDYLYFVARGDGTSQYSSNYREHKEAVMKYQAQRRQ